jgi:hypothetical protein
MAVPEPTLRDCHHLKRPDHAVAQLLCRGSQSHSCLCEVERLFFVIGDGSHEST